MGWVVASCDGLPSPLVLEVVPFDDPRQGEARYPDKYLYEALGLVRLEPRTRNFPWAKA